MIALATCAAYPDGDTDDAALPGLLDAPFVVWDDPDVDWSRFDLVVLRSVWDYMDRRDEFLAWAERIGDRLHNPPEVVRWNTDKRYLAGLPRTVPTTFLAPGEPVPALADEVVVKPTVSAGSRDTARFAAGDPQADALARRIEASGRVAMVQPYLRSVDERGETALLFFGGELSHAMRKGQILQPGAGAFEEVFNQEDMTPREATAAELAVAREVLGSLDRDLLYARVDVVDGDDGVPLLLELELTEPSLFLTHVPGSAERFAGCVKDLLQSH